MSHLFLSLSFSSFSPSLSPSLTPLSLMHLVLKTFSISAVIIYNSIFGISDVSMFLYVTLYILYYMHTINMLSRFLKIFLIFCCMKDLKIVTSTEVHERTTNLLTDLPHSIISQPILAKPFSQSQDLNAHFEMNHIENVRPYQYKFSSCLFHL